MGLGYGRFHIQDQAMTFVEKIKWNKKRNRVSLHLKIIGFSVVQHIRCAILMQVNCTKTCRLWLLGFVWEMGLGLAESWVHLFDCQCKNYHAWVACASFLVENSRPAPWKYLEILPTSWTWKIRLYAAEWKGKILGFGIELGIKIHSDLSLRWSLTHFCNSLTKHLSCKIN